jgi:hypothetical protein
MFLVPMQKWDLRRSQEERVKVISVHLTCGREVKLMVLSPWTTHTHSMRKLGFSLLRLFSVLASMKKRSSSLILNSLSLERQSTWMRLLHPSSKISYYSLLALKLIKTSNSLPRTSQLSHMWILMNSTYHLSWRMIGSLLQLKVSKISRCLSKIKRLICTETEKYREKSYHMMISLSPQF